MNNKPEIYKQALDKWGYLAQRDQLLEEMAELQKVLLHDCRATKEVSREEVICELADVSIMVEQITQAWKAEKEVENMIDFKLKRLVGILSE